MQALLTEGRMPCTHGAHSPAVVDEVFVGPTAGAPMVSREHVEAVRGKGLVGDRYYDAAGTFSRRRVKGREVTDLTLVEREVIELLRARGVALDAAATRRNVVTHGVALNDLVGRRFWVGEVELLGVNLCEPCAALFASASRREALRGLAHRGGLRARILSDGVIRAGDPVVTAPVAGWLGGSPGRLQLRRERLVNTTQAMDVDGVAWPA